MVMMDPETHIEHRLPACQSGDEILAVTPTRDRYAVLRIPQVSPLDARLADRWGRNGVVAWYLAMRKRAHLLILDGQGRCIARSVQHLPDNDASFDASYRSNLMNRFSPDGRSLLTSRFDQYNSNILYAW